MLADDVRRRRQHRRAGVRLRQHRRRALVHLPAVRRNGREDSTLAKTLAVTVQFDAATATQTWHTRAAYLELIP
jgi:hypothetical protein